MRGKLHYFGALSNPDGAMRLWLAEKDYLLIGEQPPTWMAGLTMKEVCDLYEADATIRHSRGELCRTYFRDLRHACRFVSGHPIARRLAKDVTPEHFAALRQAVADTGRNLRSQSNLICSIRAILKWAQDMGHISQMNFGPRFAPPSSDAIARERDRDGSTRFISREAILAMLEKSSRKMKAMILLGINCGFYASDSTALTFDRLHLDGTIQYHDLPRVKNGRRRAAVLWSETSAAILDYADGRRSGPVFLNQRGEKYGPNASGHSLHGAFRKLAEDSGAAIPAGANMGSLRHTYGTVVDLCSDQAAIDLTMGHVGKSVQKRVYSQLNLDEFRRLQAVASTVHEWLYCESGKK
ncbi:MAG: site-specific integrase [Patescibacteria group bacterium]